MGDGNDDRAFGENEENLEGFGDEDEGYNFKDTPPNSDCEEGESQCVR